MPNGNMIYGFIRKSTLKSVIIHACMDFMLLFTDKQK